jgi:hypothetical protein
MAAVLLAGCPFPIPPGYQASRANLEDRVPAFIKAGETTREEVFMALGEPDAVAIDETWTAYGSEYGQGGMGLVVFAGGGAAAVAGQSVRYRRLVIQFDPKGIVTATRFESSTCSQLMGGIGNAGGESKPCLDIMGRDIPSKYKLQDRRPDTN